jgi:hypothetical protein
MQTPQRLYATFFLSQKHPVRLNINLIARALQCRQTAADPDVLFAARTMLSQLETGIAVRRVSKVVIKNFAEINTQGGSERLRF